MTSREKILQQVKQNQPILSALPLVDIPVAPKDWTDDFAERLETLHVAVFKVGSYDEIKTIIQNNSKNTDRIVTTIEQLNNSATYIDSVKEDAHNLENVELAIIPAHFGVAENGAVWVTDDLVKYRVLPFIAQQLAVVVNKKDIVANMHQAYERIAGTQYEFAAFIAGPSKTADIEQSLVLGAHGPKGMMVFIADF
jgi:L-lactate dehydrogenase complex protein LldG